MKRKSFYQAYLLRCWYEEESATDDFLQGRFTIEEVLHDRRTWAFSKLEDLITLLEQELISGFDEETVEKK
jgi:hypothetical protein